MFLLLLCLQFSFDLFVNFIHVCETLRYTVYADLILFICEYIYLFYANLLTFIFGSSSFFDNYSNLFGIMQQKYFHNTVMSESGRR